MKKILFILLALLAVACSKQKLADMNVNTKSPANVSGNSLFTFSEKVLSDQDVLNDFDLWAQYLNETTYEYEAQYNVFNHNVPDAYWEVYYRNILGNLKRADSLIKMEHTTDAGEQAAQENRLTIIDIVSCYAWDQMETIWGNIPYSEALNVNNLFPKYDDAKTIHEDLISRVTADVKALDASTSDASFGSADLIYGGDVSAWKKFGNGLLIKMAVQISAVSSESSLVTTTISNAIADGTISSPADNAMFDYLSGVPNENPLYNSLVLSGRKDYVAANTIIDVMDSLKDPRLPLYFDQNLGLGIYQGGSIGNTSAYADFTHIAQSVYNKPDLPHPLMTYSEIQFYLAEAAARGLFTGGDAAATYYNNAVTASIEFWGGTAADAVTYLAQPTVVYDAANWENSIGTQAWISFYLRGYLAWTEWRRLDTPAFNEPPHLASGVVTFPFRFPYPSNEQTLNGANYTAASIAIGGDLMSTKLYWDVY